MKKVLTILFGLILLSGFAGTLYYLYSKSEEPPTVWETEEPFTTTIIHKAVATGSVIPRKEVEIKPQVSGVVSELFVEAGDTVREGDLIARIRIIPNLVNLSSAENRVERARIALDDARLDLDRLKPLFEDGIIPRTDLQEAEIAYENAEQEVEASADNLELIRKGTRAKSGESTNTLVRATIDGMVLEVPLEEGDFVIESNTFNDGTTIASVADMDELVFEGKVDESEVGKIRPGMELLLTIGAVEDERFEAILEHIAPKGIEENGAIQFEIRAAMEPREGVFVRANYSANADIVLDRADDVLAIHESLLQFDGEQAYVEVETAPQTFARRDVETGISDGISVHVLSGVSEGDRIKNPNRRG
jgi:HlyD family secretion protein